MRTRPPRPGPRLRPLAVMAALVLALAACTSTADPTGEDPVVAASTPEATTSATASSTEIPTGSPAEATPTASPTASPTAEATPPDVASTSSADGVGHALPGADLLPEPDLTDAVRLEVGTDLRAAVDAEPPGTTFLIAAGEHRGQTIVARDSDTFVGEPGAVLNGARVVEGFELRDGVWVSGGHTEEPSPFGETDEGWANEANPHDVFLDGVRKRHVLTRAEVGPGEFYFDYDADELVLGDDPTGAVVELAVTPTAIEGPGTSDVTVRRLEVRHYAMPAQRAAVDATGTSGWTIGEVRAVDNHAAGIRLGSGTEVHGCVAQGNGQMGVIGGFQEEGDRPMLVQGCLVVDNARLGFTWFWEAGATKFFDTHGMVFRDNEIIDNDGPGIWFDTQNTGAQILGNTIRGNAINGIFYELSADALIEGNTIVDNGAEGGALAAGIFVANSPGVTVRGNTLRGNTNEVVGVQSHHGDEIDIPRLVEDLQVLDNDITITDGFVGLSVTTGQDELYTDGGNRFAGNRYVLDGCDPCFLWGEEVDVDAWQALGNDVDGTFERR